MNTIVGIEIGTSKTIALVADYCEPAGLVITGMGVNPSVGIRKGGVVDVEYAVISAQSAIRAAEESSGNSVDLVYMAVSGNGIDCVIGSGSTPVTSEDGVITEEHVKAATEVARSYPFSPEHLILHSLSRMFRLDDSIEVMQPIGLLGAKLSTDVLLVYGVRNRLLNPANAVIQCSPNIAVENTYFGGLCSAGAVLTHQQKEAGVLVIDYGGGTTDHVVYIDGAVQNIGSLEVGGDHVSNDIAHAFKIPQIRAEEIKILHGSAMPGGSMHAGRINIPAEVGSPAKTILPSSLCIVINARVEETLTLIRDRIRKHGYLERLGAGVVITGGCARMRDIIPLAESIFDMPCRIGTPLDINGPDVILDGPEYSTCVGVLQNAAKHHIFRNRESLWAKLGRMMGRKQ